MNDVGHLHGLVRYPVKSMAGMPADATRLGWHGLDGDRRLAFRRVSDTGGFPWLSASRLPALLTYQPTDLEGSAGEPLPTRVRTPSGALLELRGAPLRSELSREVGEDLEWMHLRHGIFDEAAVSILSVATFETLREETGMAFDPRRFRANLLVETNDRRPFAEDAWVGGTLLVGEGAACAALGITQRAVRCAMINLDPGTGAQDARLLKAVAQRHENCVGVYATVIRPGPLRVGDRLRFLPRPTP